MIIRFSKRRWSEKHNYQLWPFTLSFSKYRTLALVLDSGTDEDAGCHLRISLYGLTVIMELLPIVLPWRKKVYAGWDAATIKRLGRDWYYNEHPREYGFSLGDGFLQIFYGVQAGSSELDQNWCCHLPWTQWRHVRYSLYDLQGNHFWTDPAGGWGKYRDDMDKLCPSASFEFDDFDGERITVRTKISEREWRFGEGWFKWLSFFRKPKISRSLELQFSKETGKRKGSWKGGTIGHGIDMLPGELHESAFRRYCAEHDMTFIGPETK